MLVTLLPWNVPASALDGLIKRNTHLDHIMEYVKKMLISSGKPHMSDVFQSFLISERCVFG